MPSRKQLLQEPKPRRFQLYRRRDATGISGTGIVAEGIEHRDGSVQYHWLTSPSTWQSAPSIHAVEHIHGHGNKTDVRYIDDEQHGGEDKTIAEVYEDRNRLAVAFSKLAEEAAAMADVASVPGPFQGYGGGYHLPDADDADADDWAITWANLPTGQVSWHVPRNLAELSTVTQDPIDWDGHTRDEKNDRLLDYSTSDW